MELLYDDDDDMMVFDMLMESLKKPSRTYDRSSLAFDDHMMYDGGAFGHPHGSLLSPQS